MSAANVTDTDFVYVFPSGIAADASGSVALNWADAGGAFGQKSPVTRGVRRSLVAWAYGPAFR